MENQRRENRGRRTTGTGYKARAVDSSRAPSSSSPSSAMGGIPDDDARRRPTTVRFGDGTTTKPNDAGHLFTPRRRRGKGGRSRRRARVPSSFDDETNHPSPGVSRVMMTRSVRDRSAIDRSAIDRGVEDASSRRRVGFGWVIFLFVRFPPVSSSDGGDGGRRGRRTRAPTRGSGRVGFARAHTSALRQPLVVVAWIFSSWISNRP